MVSTLWLQCHLPSAHLLITAFFILQGAERKTRDEERRAAKRKMTATGRKKLDELYHPVVDRSEFYAMSDMNKPPVLFSPAEDIDKVSHMMHECEWTFFKNIFFLFSF